MDEEALPEISTFGPRSGANVLSWSEFIAAVYSPSVIQIDLKGNITRTSGSTIMNLTSKDLIINGNGNTINFTGNRITTIMQPSRSTTGKVSFVNVKLESSGVVFKNNSYSNWDILINNVFTTSIAGLLDNSNTNSGKVVFDGNNSIRGKSVLVKGYKYISFLGSTTTEMTSNTTIQASRADRFNVSFGANVSFKNTNTTGDALVVGNTSRVELNIEKGSIVNVKGNVMLLPQMYTVALLHF